MPDADGRFRGISVPADAWERVFGAVSEPCRHECDSYPSGWIVVSDEEFNRNPLGNFIPPRIVPCKKCGAPLDRGHYDGMISIPALTRGPEWPPWQEDEDAGR